MCTAVLLNLFHMSVMELAAYHMEGSLQDYKLQDGVYKAVAKLEAYLMYLIGQVPM